MTFAIWRDHKSPVDRRNAEERKRRARHWLALRRAARNYGARDAAARAFVILFLLVLAIFAAGGPY